MLMDFDPDITGIASQPFWLHWQGEDGQLRPQGEVGRQGACFMLKVVLMGFFCLLATACGGGGAATASRAQPSVSAAEASAALGKVAALAAHRTPGAAALVCGILAMSCDGLSSVFLADPASAPLTPPAILCDLALPPFPGQSGARLLVITGRDASGRAYVGQVLVERLQGHPVLHEPAFWEAIRYTRVAPGLAWDAPAGAPSSRAAHDQAVRSACADPSAFIAGLVPAAGTSP
jgi:hypothetical protein